MNRHSMSFGPGTGGVFLERLWPKPAWFEWENSGINDLGPFFSRRRHAFTSPWSTSQALSTRPSGKGISADCDADGGLFTGVQYDRQRGG